MKTGIATVSISGSLVEKLHAAANAGFDGVEIFENDLTQSELTPRQVRQLAESLGLEIIALQPLRNFEAMPEPLRKQNFYQARKKFELMHELGTSKLMICSNVSPHVIDDPARAAADLHELAELAQKEHFMIGYEALAWGRFVHDYDQAWDIVKRADHSHLGILLDTFHMYARNNTLDTLRNEITADKIALVQLADAPSLKMDVLNFSRHFRCFPGQGDMPILEFMQCLKEKGYHDYISHEIFNDGFRASQATEKAIDGMRSLIWLGEQLKEPEVPKPTIDELAFIEFAIEGEDGQQLVDLFKQLGFSVTHRHRSKNVDLMRQGNINLVLNHEPKSQAHQYFLSHGVSVCALGLGTSSVAQMIKRTKHYGCARFNNQAGPGELNIPAIKGVGDQLIYFVDSQSQPEFFDIDFVPVAHDQEQTEQVGLRAFDHVGQTVLDTDMLSATFFFKALFGFDIEPSQDLTDINGLVTSRVAKSPDGKIRIPFNSSSARNSAAQRFVNRSQGAGVQQIAFNCEDIFATVKKVARECILPIPANYYRDLDARFQLDPELLTTMQEYNVLYDENDDGHFFHFYTKEHFGVFFEVVQRVNYQGYGEPNAHIRLAAQAREQQRSN
ncbi:sugar phosphate isomerase/epimerase and 4-hydroxyphenylpyruvate domain-containing protein [Vibrio fluvialis]|nr:sugar phosphate isomerase/epimerase and 4-hydroxyphenylpyruvate domain-containing protein [Vibrio fluvialis]